MTAALRNEVPAQARNVADVMAAVAPGQDRHEVDEDAPRGCQAPRDSPGARLPQVKRTLPMKGRLRLRWA